MSPLVPLAWIVGSTLFFVLLVWIGVRMIRWAKRGSRATDLLGLGMGLPAAGVNPHPPPQEFIEEMEHDIHGRKNSDAADPKDP
jgi:hypothetical protein